MKLYTPAPIDIFCTKLFTGRSKDQKDLVNLLTQTHHTMRFFRRYKKAIPVRVAEYIKLNPKNAPYAVNLYNHLCERYPHVLEPLFRTN